MELPEHIRRKIAELRRRFVAETGERVVELAAAVDAAEAGEGSLLPVRQAMHDLQGNGATFGFPSVTRIAGEAGSYVRSLERVDAAAATAIHRYLEAIREIIDDAVETEGVGPGERVA